MRKLLALVLALALVFGTVGFAAAAPSDVAEDAAYAGAVERLMALGIVSGYEDGTYRPGNIVTRAEFAKLVVATLGLEDAAAFSAGMSLFSDVPADAWYAGYVNVAASQGLIVGYPDGTFQPNKTVSYPEAITILVRALGYSDEDLVGTWPLNYIVKASTLGVSDDVTITAAGANRGDVAILLDNTLFTTIKKTEENETPGALIEERLEVEKVTAVVPADLTVTIDSDDYEVDAALRGMKADLYIRDGELIFAQAAGNKVVELTEIDHAALNTTDGVYEIYLEDEGDADYTVEDTATFFYNGAVIGATDEVTALGEAEYIKLIDNDDDDEYDFVVITNYGDALIVSDVDAIGDEQGVEVEGTANIESVNFADEDVEVTIVGDVTKLEDIEEDDVIHVAKADGEEIYEVMVVRSTVEGEVTEIEEGTTTDTVVIGGNEYDAKASLSLAVGSEGTFILDKDGTIVKFIEEEEEEAEEYYAYLIGTDEIDAGFGDTIYKVKFYNAAGEEVVYEVVYDDDAVDGTTWSNLAVGDYFKYEVDADGKIDSITEFSLTPANGEYAEATKRLEIDTDADSNIDETYYVTDSTIIWHVYDDEVTVYSAEDLVDFDLSEAIPVAVYDVDEDFNEVGLLVIASEEAPVVETTDDIYALFDKTTFAKNGDDTVVKLYALVDGEEVTYLGEDDTITVAGTQGDVVKLTVDEEGFITESVAAIEPAYVSGTVYAVDSTRIKVDNVGGTAPAGMTLLDVADDVVVYEYNEDEGTVSAANLNDIAAYDADAEIDGSVVNVYYDTDDEEVFMIVIVIDEE